MESTKTGNFGMMIAKTGIPVKTGNSATLRGTLQWLFQQPVIIEQSLNFLNFCLMDLHLVPEYTNIQNSCFMSFS